MDGSHVIGMDDRFHPVHVQCGEGFLEESPDHSAADPLVPVVLFANNNTNFAFVIIAVNVFDSAVSNELVIDQNTKQLVCLGREVVAIPLLTSPSVVYPCRKYLCTSPSLRHLAMAASSSSGNVVRVMCMAFFLASSTAVDDGISAQNITYYLDTHTPSPTSLLPVRSGPLARL